MASFEVWAAAMHRLTALLLVILPFGAHSWNDAGHMITGIIAYQQMSQDSRGAIVERLVQHKRFKQDFAQLMPLDVPSSDEGMWLFAKAATWPDMARHFRHVGLGRSDLVFEFHYERWHYASMPIFLNEEDRMAWSALGVGLQKEWTSGLNLTGLNALQALRRALQMQSHTTADSEKALLLTWIFHLVGDIHQPLHTAGLFSEGAFPKGDRGGQGLSVFAHTLASLWDSAVASGTTWSSIKALAQALVLLHGSKAEAAVAKENPELWVSESYALAESVVYTPMILSAAAAYSSPQRDIAITLTDQYTEKMKATAHERATIAGFRLARLLQELYPHEVAARPQNR